MDEVIIALPHASHEEVLAIIARCDGLRVDVKVFPDLFQIMASEVSIGDLNGLPLMSVRDVALRGWRRCAYPGLWRATPSALNTMGR